MIASISTRSPRRSRGSSKSVRSRMRRRAPDLADLFCVEHFPRTSRRRPIVRLYRVDQRALTQVSFNGSGVRFGQRLVFAVDPELLVTRPLREVLRALRILIKRLRDVRGAATLPSAEALEVFKLKEDGLTVRQIAAKFGRRWRDCSDVESRERRVKRY